MRVLIVTASRHGSTSGIAAAIAAELQQRGIQVVESEPARAPSPTGFDAVILGSAIYMGNWLADARRYVHEYREELISMSVWMFSSGPLGDDPAKPLDDPERLIDALDVHFVQEHRIFAGRLEPGELALSERLIARAFRAPDGDFRDWDAISAWAQVIADELKATDAPLSARN